MHCNTDINKADTARSIHRSCEHTGIEFYLAWIFPEQPLATTLAIAHASY